MIDFDLVKEIKNRADIVEVISYFLPSVQKKGKNYVAVCPFHDDHDPSMQISKDKQSFRCFVCSTGGDVFTFVQEYDKCSFEDAVRKVCEIINFDDPRLHKKTYAKPVDENLVPVYNCITELQKFYQYGLTIEEGKVACDYLDSRKINNEQRVKFGLGYAVNDGKTTIKYLQQKGFSLKNIENTGIAMASTSSMSDRNAGRLIFPIHDINGQVVGFSARKMTSGDDLPKYVNTPETVIFTKGNVLYNLNNAKQTIKHDGYVYLVEGFMDVFALDSIGITSAVALMSTKLTNQHIEMLRRFNVELRLCLDGDKPGQEAMMKIMAQLDEANLNYRIVSLPGELRDPDEILKQDGPEKLQTFISTLVEPFDFALNYYKNTSPLNSVEDKKKVIKHFSPIILRIKSKFDQDNYIYKLSEVTNFAPQAIKNYLKEYEKSEVKNTPLQVDKTIERTTFDISKISKQLRRITIAERTVLELMCNYKEAVQFFEQNIKYFYINSYREISNFIMELAYETEKSEDYGLSLLLTKISSSDIENKKELLNEISDLSLKKEKPVYSEQLMKDCLQAIKEERERIYQLDNLKKACEGKDPLEQGRIISEYVINTNKNKTKE